MRPGFLFNFPCDTVGTRTTGCESELIIDCQSNARTATVLSSRQTGSLSQEPSRVFIHEELLFVPGRSVLQTLACYTRYRSDRGPLFPDAKAERNKVVAAEPFSALVAIPTVRPFYISSPPLVSPVGESCGYNFVHGLTFSLSWRHFCADGRRGFLLCNLGEELREPDNLVVTSERAGPSPL